MKKSGFLSVMITVLGLCTSIYGQSSVQLDLKVFLEGPYSISSGEMDNYLQCFDYLPNYQPYSVTPWEYDGSESMSSACLGEYVDWILVEVWTGTSPASLIFREVQACILTVDGSVLNCDCSLPTFTSYRNMWVVIRHRNHLDILSSSFLTSSINGVISWDFTSGDAQTYHGNLGIKEINDDVYGMISADGVPDGQIDNNDKDLWSSWEGCSGYLAADFNLDGQVNNADKWGFWSPNQGRASQAPSIPAY